MNILATLVFLGLECALITGPALASERPALQTDYRICAECDFKHGGQERIDVGTLVPQSKEYRIDCGTLRGTPYQCRNLIPTKVYHCSICNHWALFPKRHCTEIMHDLSQPCYLPNQDSH
ncbi:hypothetical protein PGT21_033641 [Puccinia graminis f. sp. tritici]|uniref:Uncharacterized protein n=1 Tax=Puccinia graminis f. sp. tritici TaxID=56615 RepID=A0A5B0PZK5_PUCGR|nr:hypothetical protein PGT21_033641 [Puccinia graminis f. sp. tritici]KAA1109400.1 hypothetical protein PGTUg99_032253 [Puccinia graminis f. sp. tritici]